MMGRWKYARNAVKSKQATANRLGVQLTGWAASTSNMSLIDMIVRPIISGWVH